MALRLFKLAQFVLKWRSWQSLTVFQPVSVSPPLKMLVKLARASMIPAPTGLY